MTNLVAELRQAGFKADPTHNGCERWTHFAKDITCLRQKYMNDAQWIEEQKRCLGLARLKL